LSFARGDDVDPAPVLLAYRLPPAERPLVHCASPVGAQAGLGHAGDLPAELLRLGKGAAGLDQALDETDLQRFLGGHGAASKDQVEGPTVPDEAGQAHRAEIDQGHAKPAIEDAQRRTTRGHPEVAPQRKLQPTGDGVALDRRDHRLAQHHPRRAHRTLARFAQPVARAGGERLQVKARAEVAARPCEDRDRETVIGVEAPEALSQRRRRLGVDRVPDLRALDGDGDNRPIDLEPNGPRARLARGRLP